MLPFVLVFVFLVCWFVLLFSYYLFCFRGGFVVWFCLSVFASRTGKRNAPTCCEWLLVPRVQQLRVAGRTTRARCLRCVWMIRRLAFSCPNSARIHRRWAVLGAKKRDFSGASTPNAVSLNYLEFPATKPGTAGVDDTPVVFIHGLLGSSMNFRTMCRKPDISGARDAYSIDLRNHGSSPHSPDVSWAAMAADVAAFIRSRGIDHVHVVGHSLGGRVAMATALLHPEIVKRLIVVDVAPVDYQAANDAGEDNGTEVTQSSFAVLQAMKNLDLEHLSAIGADRAQLDEALSLQPGMEDAFVRGFVLQNCVQRPDVNGLQWTWRVGLDELLNSYHSTLTRWPYMVSAATTRTASTIPHETLFIGGSKSPYMRGHETAIRALCPNVHIEMVEGAGHYVHSEKPADFVRLVSPFLAGGWTQHIDPKTKNKFFFQSASQTSQWDPPPL